MGSSPIASIQYGALAQLGARYIRIVEAVGSNPICSIFLCHASFGGHESAGQDMAAADRLDRSSGS